jgi:hypothetical protein
VIYAHYRAPPAQIPRALPNVRKAAASVPSTRNLFGSIVEKQCARVIVMRFRPSGLLMVKDLAGR